MYSRNYRRTAVENKIPLISAAENSERLRQDPQNLYLCSRKPQKSTAGFEETSFLQYEIPKIYCKIRRIFFSAVKRTEILLWKIRNP